MPGSLNHSPGDILRHLLVSMGHGSLPSSNTTWPIGVGNEQATPDNVITIYDTDGDSSGRTMNDGERAEFHGIQVRVRSATHPVGYAKIRAVAVALDSDVYQESVVIGSDTYRIHAISRTGDILDLGTETPESKRRIYTFNAKLTARLID